MHNNLLKALQLLKSTSSLLIFNQTLKVTIVYTAETDYPLGCGRTEEQDLNGGKRNWRCREKTKRSDKKHKNPQNILTKREKTITKLAKKVTKIQKYWHLEC